MNNRINALARRMGGLAAVAIVGASAVANVEAAEKESERNSLVLEEIVVTAQKRLERLQDVPISISVLSGEALERSSSRGVADGLSQIGGVVVTQGNPGGAAISVRGVVAGAGTATTAYYQDDVPFSFYRRADLVDPDAFDLARVEVLRGSQGTLYGANALSGVVRVLTNEAHLTDYQAKVRMRGSSTEGAGGNYSGDVAVNVPLIPGKLAIRGVAGYSDLSGYIDSPFDGQTRINDAQTQNYRFKVNYQPTENLGVRFSATRSDVHNGAPASGGEDLTTVFSSNRPLDLVVDVYGLVTEYNWSGVSLLSSTGYIDYAADGRSEAVIVGGFRPTLADADVKSFTQELRLSSRSDGPWKWLVGAYYKDLTDLDRQDVRPAFPFPFGLRNESESYAAFGDVTRSLGGGRFELTTGLRYFKERAVSIEEGDLFGRPLLADRSADFDRVTGRVVLAYKPHERLMVYGSVGNAFRSGQIQGPGSFRASNLVPAVVDPDTLITYEMGAKGVLFEGSIAYDAAVYYQDWDKLQQELILPPPIGLTARINAGGASGAGADATVSYQPSRAFTIHGSVGWSDLKIDEEVFSRGIALFTKGASINGSAEWTGSVGGSYRAAMFRPGVDFVLSTNFAYGSERPNRFLSGNDVAISLSDELRTWNLSVGLEGDRWSAGIYGDNLLGEHAAVNSPSPFLSNEAIRQRPRTIGLQVMVDY